MKAKTLTKIAIASVLCAPSCANSSTEKGVVIAKNRGIIFMQQINGPKNLHNISFHPSTYWLLPNDAALMGAVYNCVVVGDTIVYKNPYHSYNVDVVLYRDGVFGGMPTPVIKRINGMNPKRFVKQRQR